MHKGKKIKSGKILLPSLKSALSALIITMAAVMVFALFVKNFEIDNKKIEIINQVIKVTCCVWAAFFASADKSCRKILAGGLSAVIYISVGFVIFSAVSGNMGDLALFGCDAAMAFALGIITAVLVCKVLKKDSVKSSRR